MPARAVSCAGPFALPVRRGLGPGRTSGRTGLPGADIRAGKQTGRLHDGLRKRQTPRSRRRPAATGSPARACRSRSGPGSGAERDRQDERAAMRPARRATGPGAARRKSVSVSKDLIMSRIRIVWQSPRRAQSASSPVSPVRTRIACSTSRTKIFPSPILPVFAVVERVSTAPKDALAIGAALPRTCERL